MTWVTSDRRYGGPVVLVISHRDVPGREHEHVLPGRGCWCGPRFRIVSRWRRRRRL